MTTSELARQVCPDVVRRVSSRSGREFVVTTFRYADGDFVNVYLRLVHGRPCLSDEGNTDHKLRVAGVRLTENRSAMIEAICSLYEMTLDSGVFLKEVDLAQPASSLLAFCEGIVRVSNLEFGGETTQRSYFPEQVDMLIETRVKPVRGISRRWTNPELDPEGAYPVDYHMNTKGPTRHVFVVASTGKSTLVAAVSNFFRAHRIEVPSMAILDPDLELKGRPLERLRLALTELRFGVSGNEDSIVSFAVGS